MAVDVALRLEPVIVPPSWNKGEHHQILSKVWGRAAREMGEAVGFGVQEALESVGVTAQVSAK